MKKILGVVTLGVLVSISSSFAISKADAEKKIEDYLKGSKYVSKIHVCENDKYFIGEAYLEGYEKLPNTVRIVFVNKKTGDMLPEMGAAHSYCYMLEKWKK